MSKDELPSINDILGDNNLPSYKDFLEKKEELPSVEEYITESNQNTVEEETQTIENADGESFLEVVDVVKAPEWAELVRLVNDVRKDIPQIPEIKSYDDELSNICEQITQIQTNFSLLDAKSDKITDLSAQNEEFEGKLTEIESKIPEIPEIRYYDEDIRFIYDKISRIKEDINNLPEVKYYEEDLKSLQERIEEVNKTIPTFPDWVQEAQEVPDFSWIGKNFSLIDDDFNKVQGHLDVIREKIDYQVNELTESLEKKEFEINVDIKRLTEELTDTSVVFNEVKENLYKEMRDCSVRLWEHHKEFKDDDRKLKKAILSEQNKLKQSLQKEIKEINEQSVKADESILNFFVDLKETVDSLPQVKYYDEDVSRIDEDILSIRKELKELSQLAYLIKTEQTELKENYLLNEPPSEKETAGNQTDPLTPLDQKFATLDDLASHYRLFINRITTQLATLGGGGEVRLEFLDDVDRDTAKVDGKFLKYQSSTGKWVGADASGGGVSEEASKLVLDARNNNVGYAITIGTPVYQTTFNSGQDRINIEEARASDSTTMPAKGVTTTDLDNNTNGQILVYGELEGVDTSAFEVADELFVAPGGGLTNTRPTDPSHLVQKIAVVLKKSASNGAILVYGAGRTNDVPNTISIGGSITASEFYGDGSNLTGITVGAGGTWSVDSVGINTVKNVGIGTTAKDGYKLYVEGDARVTGILTVGPASVTIDGINNRVTSDSFVGALTGSASSIGGVSSSFLLDYNNFTNTPTIPSDTGDLTNGAGFVTFTNNNQLTNGAGYITTSFTNTNQLTNGAGFITASDDIIGTAAGLSGSPNITVSAITATSGEFSGNVTIGGTLTYEDVNNIDSVGLVTARLGVNVTGGEITVGSAFSVGQAGVVTASSFVGNLTGSASSLGGVSSSFLLDYNNFTNTPTIPTNNNELTNGAGYITTSFTNTNQLTNGAGFVTFTNNNQLTNGAGYITTSFTNTNQLTNGAGFVTFTNNNQLTNGAGYITTSFTNTNQLTNGAGFITASDDITGTSAGLSGSPNITVGAITASSAEFSGNVTIGGTLTYDDVTNIDSLGIVTARTGVDVLSGGINVVGVSTISTGVGTVHVGLGSTALLVDGDARITGILTVGRGSVTIDGDNNTVTTGIVTITNSQVILGDNVTINASATGINSAPNVLYVAKDGSDSNNGTSIDNAKLTIASAVSIAQSGTTIKVLSGNYVESNPIELPAFTAVVGDDLRTVKVLPSTTDSDIFHVNKGCKLANMTFSGHVAPAAAVAFPSAGATNVGGGKWKGPYIQNCTSDTTTGTGIYIDGDKAEKTKSMNVDAFTQYNQGGVGVAVTNEGYAQLVSVFTICCDKAIAVHKGGQADLANSNCSFGTQGLVADGVSPEQFTGIVTASAAASQDNVTINVGAVTTRPYDGQVVYFDKLYKSVDTITITSGGSGYTSTPSVTISSPTGPNGEVATAFATLENGVVTEIDIISSGSQYDPTDTVTVTISAPDSGTTATATANLTDTYYTINSATPIVSGITTLTLAENLINTVGVGSTAYFFQQSKIVASSHTFEYIGSGNTITLATPKRGGVTIQANEVVSQNGGRVIYTSTDQAGNFRIGDDLQINQATGTISGRAFSKSLFSEMTPFILALS